jgi:hypothetical protein
MQFRQGMINLAITCGLVLLVAIASLLLRECRPLPVAVPVATPKTVTPGATPAQDSGPKQRPVESTFLSFPNPKLIESSSNEADTLRLQVGKEEQVFVLYYVDALDATPAHPDRINEQATFFGKASPQAVLETGREAWSYVKELLSTRKFLVLTRWEKVPNTERYYAIIRVEYEPGKWAYLADLLMRQGYARINGLQTPLPDNTPTVENYIGELMTHAKYARQKKLGIWSRVK